MVLPVRAACLLSSLTLYLRSGAERSQCLTFVKKIENRKLICILEISQGLSGAPLRLQDRLIGVSSLIIDGCNSSSPYLFSSVRDMRDFIDQVITDAGAVLDYTADYYFTV